MAEVQGHCGPAFEKVRELLANNVASEDELGAAICVNINGKNVVDIWAGYTDEKRTSPWRKDTLVNIFSSTKTLANLAVLIAASQGHLNVREKVSKYWPEFAQNGKENVEVRHILSHSSGVSGWAEPVTLSDICDVEKSSALLAKQAPWWEPGTASGYHALNLGHLDGELLYRTTGKRLKQFVAEEMAGPLGADVHLGVEEKDWPRVSTLIPPPPLNAELQMEPGSITFKTFTNPVPDAMSALTPEWRAADLGAVNGHANARSMNRVLSMVSLGGEIDGKRYLTPEIVDDIFQEQVSGPDLAIGANLRFGIGFGLPCEGVPFLPEGRKVAFWGGWGGSAMIMDVENKATITYVMNKMGEGTLGNVRTVAYVNAIYDVILGRKKSAQQ